MKINRSFNRGSFPYIEAMIRRDYPGTSFGRAFEWLCRYFLETAPKYAGMFDKIWRWDEWPDRWGIDKGIDLVARTTDGRLWAVQAKAVNPDRSISKQELDSFLSESNRPQFDFRLIIATTDDIGRNARETIAGQQIPVDLILRGDLLNAEIAWPTRIGEAPRPLPRKKPRPHQAAAIRDVVRGFRHRDRGQLIMAFGTGKTLTALWIAEKLQNHRTLVLVPSLSLISQTLSEWGRTSRHPLVYWRVKRTARVGTQPPPDSRCLRRIHSRVDAFVSALLPPADPTQGLPQTHEDFRLLIVENARSSRSGVD